MTMLEPRIYLASQSPRRRELLAQIGVRFDLLLFRSGSRIDAATCEDPLPGETPDVYALRVAAAKARHGAQLQQLRRLPARLVLAADTTLDVDGEIVGKPQDDAAATAILSRLAGRTHRVLTAVAVAYGRNEGFDESERIEQRLSISEVRFRSLTAAEIQRYVASGEPRDKAGAYGIQGYAAMFIEEIRGSHSGIVGLPLCETALLLRESGYPV
ncbi:MAG: septum formation inhibitor Maf [Gammaproteobacteria bacterium]|nr:septum formation inhibitor Maf [Rhodocyclaceae bacterium]MBU3907989.1 septum formation inhibitor Maf [Gammaproteobacteria bacterium]MBU3990629.1 septum formation inhibitor Maf [Gammaproteobacteria bacterium]MBU4006080.1 septum formation inhibitor Maf [Gammaproteobacteria bacterium]MBU4022081.1 septum formation inhibitor Maf [Gammaproteobacteria bacterium]